MARVVCAWRHLGHRRNRPGHDSKQTVQNTIQNMIISTRFILLFCCLMFVAFFPLSCFRCFVTKLANNPTTAKMRFAALTTIVAITLSAKVTGGQDEVCDCNLCPVINIACPGCPGVIVTIINGGGRNLRGKKNGRHGKNQRGHKKQSDESSNESSDEHDEVPPLGCAATKCTARNPTTHASVPPSSTSAAACLSSAIYMMHVYPRRWGHTRHGYPRKATKWVHSCLIQTARPSPFT